MVIYTKEIRENEEYLRSFKGAMLLYFPKYTDMQHSKGPLCRKAHRKQRGSREISHAP